MSWDGKWTGPPGWFANIKEIFHSHWGETYPGTEYRECVACQRPWPCAAYRLAAQALDMFVLPR